MRLDTFLYENGYYVSRNKASEGISRGEVFYNGNLVGKPSFDVKETDADLITVKKTASDFVSVGGFKLEKALNDFDFDVNGLICADIGASTGGFTDCLLQRGAKKVFAVDLNDSLLSEKLFITNVIRIVKNARFLKESDFNNEKLDLIVADLSFISETMVLPVFYKLLTCGKHAIILIKPQFEGDKKVKRKNGIVRHNADILTAIKKVVDSALNNGFLPEKITLAPINDKKNREFLLLLKKDGNEKFESETFYADVVL